MGPRVRGHGESPLPQRDWLALALKACVLYCVISIATLPFLGSIWLSELPLLAVPQVPKVVLANWLRTQIVMPFIELVGASRGSFSPDWHLAGPYALGLAYMVVVGPLSVAVCRRPRTAARNRWLLALVALVVADFVFTLAFTRGPGLTMY